MRWFWILIVGLVLLVLEVSVVAALRRFGGGPDLVLLFVVFLALYAPLEDAPLSGWILGMGKDALSAGPLGLYAVLFMGIAFFLSRIRADIFTEYNSSHMVNAGISTLLVCIGAALWHSLEGVPLSGLAASAAGVAVWSALLAPVVFRGLFLLSRPLEAARRPR